MADIALVPLDLSDARSLWQFEIDNRDWFERWVGPRPDSYWQYDSLRRVIRAQVADSDHMYLIKSGTGDILGRLNLTAITGGTAQLGYRIARTASGRGVATRAVTLALPMARHAGIWALEARVADNNPASVQVLVRTGFHQDKSQKPIAEKTAAGSRVILSTYRLLLDQGLDGAHARP